MRIAIFNYGAGNLYSIRAALEREGVQSKVTRSARDLSAADAILLPGVGSFSQATKEIRGEPRELMRSGKPLLGICLGLQLFFEGSEEGPGEGLGILPGKVRRLPSSVKVPQIGWNVLKIRRESDLLDGVPDESWVYYVHSYYPETRGKWVIATSEYAIEYPSLVSFKNIYGTQFHPEKSGKTGRSILRNLLAQAKR